MTAKKSTICLDRKLLAPVLASVLTLGGVGGSCVAAAQDWGRSSIAVIKEVTPSATSTSTSILNVGLTPTATPTLIAGTRTDTGTSGDSGGRTTILPVNIPPPQIIVIVQPAATPVPAIEATTVVVCNGPPGWQKNGRCP